MKFQVMRKNLPARAEKFHGKGMQKTLYMQRECGILERLRGGAVS